MNPNQENQILAHVQAGDSRKFEHLVRRYQNAIFRILQNLVPKQMIEDLAQESFLTAFAQIRRFDPQKGSFRAWLFTITRNQAVNALRKKRETSLPETTALVDSRMPIDDLLSKEVFTQLDNQLNAMTLQDRFIFVWAEIEGLTYAEIARIEGLRLGTVKSRLARIRARLRKSLSQLRN